MLEKQFQCEWQLTGRARLACREARAGDAAEGRRADDVARLAEVRVIEEVEEVGPRLTRSPAWPSTLRPDAVRARCAERFHRSRATVSARTRDFSSAGS